MGSRRGESAESSEVHESLSVTSTAQKARSRPVKRSCDSGWSAEDVVENVIQITDIGTVVIGFGLHSARTDISMAIYNSGIRANIGFLVDTIKTRGGTASRGTRRGAVIPCWTLLRQVVTTARQRRDRNRVIRTVNDAWRHTRKHRRMTTPSDCTYTKDNITADRGTERKWACGRVSRLTKMRDVNGAADERISCWSRAKKRRT